MFEQMSLVYVVTGRGAEGRDEGEGKEDRGGESREEEVVGFVWEGWWGVRGRSSEGTCDSGSENVLTL